MSRTSRLLALVLGSLLVPLLTAHAGADSKRVVAVLYFDNNTGDGSLDVLQKGFADMMVTDLSSVSQLQLVEREKLQQIIDEQKLQHGKYFDPKTAVKLGQLVGAQYAVTGSFQAVEPQLRIDIRLLEIGTSKVLLADKVTGLKNQLFELQQQLVSRFVAGLALKLPEPPRLKSRAPDVDTLLSYSKGIDLVDQGKLQEASQQLAAVVSKAPLFLLARERHEQILERLKASEARRTVTLSDLNEQLGQRAAQFLQEPAKAEMDEESSARHLGYRRVRMQYLLRALQPHLAAKYPNVVLPGHEPQALALLQQWREQARAYVRESGEHFRRFHSLIDGVPYMSSSRLKLLPEDDDRLKLAKYGSLDYQDDAALSVAEFILLGRYRDDGISFDLGPTLADQDPSALKEGFLLMEQALQEADAGIPRQRELRTRQVLELYGDALLLRGHLEQAVAKWQLFLDHFPASPSFKNISNKIKTALGVGPIARENATAQYPQSLASCDKSGVREGYYGELNRRLRTQGYKAAREMFLELDAKCSQAKDIRFNLRSLCVSTFMTAAQSGDCDTFHALVPRYLELGGSRSDLEGYLTHYIPQCRAPGDGGI
jgi:TolB-like protein